MAESREVRALLKSLKTSQRRVRLALKRRLKLVSYVEAVNELHHSNGRGYFVGHGEGLCTNCGYSYPCPTVQLNKLLN